jgi:hypothetical protein
MKEDTTTARRLFKLIFTDLCHNNENIPNETMPSDVENHGFMAKQVITGRFSPIS